MSKQVCHPVDPLTVEEVNCACQKIKAHSQFKAAFDASVAASTTDVNQVPLAKRARAAFAEVLLQEPRKAFVKNWVPGQALNRRARALVYMINTNETFEVIVKMAEPNNNVDTCAIERVSKVDTPTFPNNNYDIPPNNDDFAGTKSGDVVPIYWTDQELKKLILDTPALLKRLAKRNVTRAMIESDEIFAWPYYTFEPFRNFIGACGGNCPDLIDLDAPNHRYMPAVFINVGIVPGGICIETANWGMLEGLYLILDSTTRTIHRIVEEGELPRRGAPPIPPAVSDPYTPLKHRELKPFCITMPDGVSFTHPNDDMHAVEWDNWSFRWSYQRGGMSLYDIRYREQVQGQPDSSAVDRRIIYKTAPTDTMVVYNTDEPIFARTYVSADSHNWPVVQRLQSLVPGRDVPSHAKLYPVVKPDYLGNAYTTENAVAIYEMEEDLLWRANQGVIDSLNWPNGGSAESTPPLTGSRARKLVVRTIFSGFYYLFVYSYIFYQDGRIEAYVDLFGQTTNQWLESNTDGEFVPQGQRISKQLLALNHTHSTMFRFDFDIDGVGNTAVERNAFVNELRGDSARGCGPCPQNSTPCRRVVPGGPGTSFCNGRLVSAHERRNGACCRGAGARRSACKCTQSHSCKCACTECGDEHGHSEHGHVPLDSVPPFADQQANPCGQMITVRESELRCEREAARDSNRDTNRTWSVHSSTKNKLGFPRGYELFSMAPNGGMRSLARDDSPAHTHYTYLKHDFFVTKYRDGEEYASGEFPVLSDRATSPPGMATYQKNNESIVDTDIVAWFNSMFFHVPHTENYPFITAHRTGVQLVPENFFDINPAVSLEQETVPVKDRQQNVIGDCGRQVEFEYLAPNCP